MRHLGRSVLLAAILCALVATGCTSGVGSSGPDNTPVRNDPAFTPDKLRAVDPCGLLDHDTLHPQGSPAGSSATGFVGTPSGFDNCGIDMKTFHHSDLVVSVMVGAEAARTTGTRIVLSGMAVMEEFIVDECDEEILTPDPKIGIMMQAQIHDAPCAVARDITTAMINHIRTDPPKRQHPPGSVGLIDPCDTVDAPTAAAAVGPSARKTRVTLYNCRWDAGPLELSVAFDVGDARVPFRGQATPQPIDLGGVAGYEVMSDQRSCEVGWNERPAAGAPHQFEVVYVDFGTLGQQPLDDTCAKTLAAARSVLTKVPKPS